MKGLGKHLVRQSKWPKLIRSSIQRCYQYHETSVRLSRLKTQTQSWYIKRSSLRTYADVLCRGKDMLPRGRTKWIQGQFIIDVKFRRWNYDYVGLQWICGTSKSQYPFVVVAWINERGLGRRPYVLTIFLTTLKAILSLMVVTAATSHGIVMDRKKNVTLHVHPPQAPRKSAELNRLLSIYYGMGRVLWSTRSRSFLSFDEGNSPMTTALAWNPPSRRFESRWIHHYMRMISSSMAFYEVLTLRWTCGD